MVARGKPAPDPVLLAIEQVNAQPEKTWMIGDSPHDLEAGRAAGVKIGAVAWGPFDHELLKTSTRSVLQRLSAVEKTFIG